MQFRIRSSFVTWFRLSLAIALLSCAGLATGQAQTSGSEANALHRQKMLQAAEQTSNQSAQPLDGGAATSGYISTIAGGSNNAATTTVCAAYTDLIGDGCPATSAILSSNLIAHVTVDQYGNIYIPDYINAVVRFIYESGPVPAVLTAQNITPTQGNIYLIAGQAQASCTDAGAGAVNSSCGDNNLATSAYLQEPIAVAVDSSQNLYILDYGAQVIREVNATTGDISLIAGTYFTAGYLGDNGAATGAEFNIPRGMALDTSGNLYIADTGNNVIRMITASNGVVSSNSTISSVAGTGGTHCASETIFNCGDNGAATAALLNTPTGVFVDPSGNIYIADKTDDRIRVVYEAGTVAQLNAIGVSSPIAGDIYTIVGDGLECATSPCGDSGSAISGKPDDWPTDVAVDSAGNLFFVDSYDYAIRKVDTSDILSTVAGTLLQKGYAGDGGLATAALLGGEPEGMALDTQGNLYIADTKNNVIRYVPGVAAATLASQTITFTLPSSTYTYGASAITLSATSNSSAEPITYALSGCTTCASLSGTSPNEMLTITAATLSGQEVTVTANQAADSTHSAATPVAVSFTVNPVTLSVAPNSKSVPFGTTATLALASLTYTVSGNLVGSDTLAGTPAYTITGCTNGNPYSATTPVDTTCTITMGLGTLAASTPNDYTIQAGGTATLSVTGGGSNTISFPAPTGPFTYGQSAITLSATANSGLPITYTSSNTAVAVVTGSNSLTITGAGSATITASQTGNSEYGAATPVTQLITVNRATITVMAQSISVPYGTAVASVPYTATTSATVSGSDVVTGTAVFSSGYTTTSAPGTMYTITPSQGSLSISPSADANNYTFSYVSGTLTVAAAANVITFVQPGNITYNGGGNMETMTVSASSGLPITLTVLSGPAVVSPAGSTTLQMTGGGGTLGVGTVTVVASQPGNVSYAAAAPVTETFVVEPATLYVTASDLTMAPGATVPTLMWSFTCQGGGLGSCDGNPFVGSDTNTAAVVSGCPLLTTTATSNSQAGTYPIVISQGAGPATAQVDSQQCVSIMQPNGLVTGLVAQNYVFSFINGTMTVTNIPTYVVTASPSTLTIRSGQTAQATVLVTPTSNYQGTVAFTCGNLPLNVTCTFSPATVTLAANSNGGVGAVQTTVTINTNAASPVVAMLAPGKGSQVMTASIFFLPGILTGLLIAFNRKRFLNHKRIQGLLMLVLLLSGLAGLSACGGGSMSNLATAGTDTITISAAGTGTSGSGSPNTTQTINMAIDITQ